MSSFVGFPLRVRRSDMGPKLLNRKPVRDPRYQVHADLLGGLLFGQVAGMNLTCLLAVLLVRIQSSAPTATILERHEAWNPEGFSTGDYADPLVTRASAGVLDISYATQVPDWDNQDRDLVFKGGFVNYIDDNTNLLTGRVIPTSPVSSVVRVRGWHVTGSSQNAADGTLLVGLY